MRNDNKNISPIYNNSAILDLGLVNTDFILLVESLRAFTCALLPHLFSVNKIVITLNLLRFSWCSCR